MKNIFKNFLLICIIILIANISNAQDKLDVKVSKRNSSILKTNEPNSSNQALFNVLPSDGGSTSNNGRAPQGSRKFNNTKYLISGAEMTASGFTGSVYSIGWHWNLPMPPAAGAPTDQGATSTGRLVVYLKDTSASATTFSGTFIDTNGTGYTKIIVGEITIPAGLGEINIDVPAGGPGTSVFTPTPGNGVLVIYIYTTYAIAPTLNAPTVSCNAITAGALLTYQSQTVNGFTGSSSAFRPETRFGNVAAGANDVGALNNMAPSGIINYPPVTTIAPKANIKNYGTATQGPFNVLCEINGPVAYSNTKSVATVSSGSSILVSFDSTFSPTVGNYSMKITTQLAGDQGPINDTLTTFFSVQNLNYGGGNPGNGGYFYSNSITGNGSPSQPGYVWIDPVAAGHTPLVFADPDDGTTPVDIGFNFTYMGFLFTTGSANLNVYVNGFLNLGTAVSGAFYGVTSFPNASNVPGMISPGCIDMHVDQAFYPTAQVYAGGDASKFVVTYFHAYRWVAANNSTDYITMQVVFYPNGNIRYQFNDAESFNHLTTFAPFCDIGLQNGLGDMGVQYRVNGAGGPMFSSPLAVEFGLNQNILPVELSSFTSSLNGRNVNLNWATTSETNNSGFEVERKIEGSAWTKVGSVAGAGTSNSTHSYNFSDRNLSTGKYNYRLKQIDNNGNFRYYGLTNEVIIGVPSKFELSQNFPNPFNPTTNINYDLPFDSKVSIKVFDLSGKEVASLINGAQTAGSYTLNFNASTLSSGVYFYQINATGGAQNFAKTMKMLLVK